MPDNATDLLKKAIAAKVADRVAALRHAPAKAEGSEPKTFQFACVQCGATNSVTAEDDDSYRTDDETAETGNSDDENDEPDNDDDPEDRASALAKRLLRAASKPTK
jgi:hypothetical protein